MNRFNLAIVASATVILTFSAQAQEDRLIPTEEKSKLSMSWRLDGKAQLITIKNESNLVLTSAKLFCELYDSSKALPKFAPNGREWCAKNLPPLAQLQQLQNKCVFPDPIERSLSHSEFPLLPGKSKEFYLELIDGREIPVSCRLEKARGRAKRFLDF